MAMFPSGSLVPLSSYKGPDGHTGPILLHRHHGVGVLLAGPILYNICCIALSNFLCYWKDVEIIHTYLSSVALRLS